MTTRIEVVGRVSGRRRWTVEQKLAILRDAFGVGGSVRAACDRHEVGSGLIYTWRRLAMSGELTGMALPSLPSVSPAFAEIEVAEPAAPVVAQPFAGPLGRIGIELRSAVRGTVDAAVDAEALAGGLPNLLQLTDLIGFQTGILPLPPVVGLFGYPNAADQICHRHPHISLLQNRHNLLNRIVASS